MTIYTGKYLEGQKLDLSSINKRKQLVGKFVSYLRKCDIDRTGRGLYFPRFGEIVSVSGKNIELDNGSWLYVSDIIEMVEVEEK